MGLYLMASFSLDLDWGWWGGLMVAFVVLGFAIFVHELGHFLVAKACGVKCEKFYLGFDIYGIKLLKFRWGETEYGIGVLPLGGYVKMLGQEDNPARLREELERAKMAEAAAETAASGGQNDSEKLALPGGDSTALLPVPDPAVVAEARQALYDPRSYLAKSVPQRMAIISAGVIMNILFAMIAAIGAYALGVKQQACGVGQVSAGSAAWQVDLRSGDQIVEINNKPALLFRDIQVSIRLGDELTNGVPLKIRRPGMAEPFPVRVFPKGSGDESTPTLGVTNPLTTALNIQGRPAAPGSPAAEAKPPFESGDRIVAIDGQPIEHYGQIETQLARNISRPMTFTVERAPKSPPGSAQPLQRLDMLVAPRKVQDLGLVMEMGPISAIQADSPAARAGLKPGDLIREIDGQPVGNPMSLPERMRAKKDHVVITVFRGGVNEPIQVMVSVRPPDRVDPSRTIDSPVSVPVLGLAYKVLNRVHAVVDGSPAAKAGIKPGDVIIKAAVKMPEQPKPAFFSDFDVKFGEEKRNWPVFFDELQRCPADCLVTLTLAGGRSAELKLAPVDGWYYPDRGLNLEPEWVKRRAQSVGDALKLGCDETVDSAKLVVKVLRKLGTQVSLRHLTGPIGILNMAAHAAQEGMADLLLFLTAISANLAVINFLPIPILDGGHMVFLAYEGLRGKPASERVQLILSYCGLIFILALMFWVIGLDIGWISRH